MRSSVLPAAVGLCVLLIPMAQAVVPTGPAVSDPRSVLEGAFRTPVEPTVPLEDPRDRSGAGFTRTEKGPSQGPCRPSGTPRPEPGLPHHYKSKWEPGPGIWSLLSKRTDAGSVGPCPDGSRDPTVPPASGPRWHDAPTDRSTAAPSTGVRRVAPPDASQDLGVHADPAVPVHLPSDAPVWLLLAAAAGAALLGPVLLYRRLDEDRVLDHGTRRRILDHVREQPGATVADVAASLDVHYETARHHLDVLVEFDHVARRRFGGRIRHFENHGRLSPVQKRLVDALSTDGRREILRALRQAPGTVSGIADRVGRSVSTVSDHLSRLRDQGLVHRRRDGRSVRYRLEEAARRGLSTLAVMDPPER